MSGMGFDMRKMMKEAQKMQANLARAQEELREMTVEGSAGGGAVRIVVTGDVEIRSVQIEDGVIDPEDREGLEDLILAAVNDGVRKAKDMANQRMAKLTGGVLPPGLA